MTTILLVEDAHDLAQIIIRELEANHYRVIYAPDGHTALHLHQEEKPDIVLLDWVLPDLNGLEVLRRIRQESVTPLLMLTARGEEVDRVLGLEIGADDYLTKPFSMRELIARIHALLRRVENIQHIVTSDRVGSRDSLQEVVRYGALTLDPQEHTISLNGDMLELSANEFEIVHLLLRSPGRTFSRSYLQETIWRTAYIGGDRSVDNAILRIRRKLGPLGDKIETVRGVGYRLHRDRRS